MFDLLTQISGVQWHWELMFPWIIIFSVGLVGGWEWITNESADS